MIRRLGNLLIATAALGAIAVAAPSAQAGMIPTSVSVIADGSNFRWTYGVVVTTDVNVKAGDSFTIYDFAGMVDGTVAMPVGWNVTQAMSGPARPGTHPTDNPGLPNLTFTYEGSEPIVGQQGLGNFWAISTFSDSNTGDFTSTTHRQVDDRAETNITTTDVPKSPTPGGGGPNDSPEPATLALFGLGLPVLGLARYLRRRKV